MRCHRRSLLVGLLLPLLLAVAPSLHAEEGLWTPDHFPVAAVEAATGVRVSPEWIGHLQASSVRLSSGCSASIVSARGLVLTNHHCVLACVQASAAPGADPLGEGVLSRRPDEERRCPGVEAQVLESITDVTAEVSAAIAGLDGEARLAARNRATSAIEARACPDRRALHCEVVALYQGGQYRLYAYRPYDDVRLAFAPEFGIAFFGGDVDNYSFPRFCLDAALLRLYRDGQPAATPVHLAWRRAAPKAGEPVFLAGHPGATSRQLTVAELEMQRDWYLPVRQLVRAELRGRLLQYAAGGVAEARAATDALFDVENKFKWFAGRSRALADPDFLAARRQAEAELRARVAADASLAAELGDPWAEADAAIRRYQEIFLRHEFLEARAGSVSDLYRVAVLLVRAADERARPSGARLEEFADSALPVLERQLLDERPYYLGVERIGLELWLLKAREYLGADSAEVRQLLGSESPAELAARLIGGTRLTDAAVRRALWQGGAAAIAASDDPLIRFVRATDAQARAVRREYEDGVSGPLGRAGERIARARFAIYGDTVYPDATFTLRLSYGRVVGWREAGRDVPPWTTVGGLYTRATAAPPFVLPPRWQVAAGRIPAPTPFDFVASLDTVNGNSGAPVVDAAGDVVGVAFDGNLPSLAGEYGYEGRRSRAVIVSGGALTAALRNVYGLPALADELESGR